LNEAEYLLLLLETNEGTGVGIRDDSFMLLLDYLLAAIVGSRLDFKLALD
jgi:hypothetical protein